MKRPCFLALGAITLLSLVASAQSYGDHVEAPSRTDRPSFVSARERHHERWIMQFEQTQDLKRLRELIRTRAKRDAIDQEVARLDEFTGA